MPEEFPLKDYKKGEDEEWLDQHPGRPTGRITKNVECPVKWLMKLPGLRGEHKKLTLDMPKIKGMADSCVNDAKWRKEHPCELGVQWDGKIYVDDGNHRIRAAKLAKLDTYPCIIKFYGGGEDEFDIKDIISKHASLEEKLPQYEPQGPEPWRENAYTKAGKVDLLPISWMKQFPYNKLRYDPAVTGGGPDGKSGSLVDDVKQNGLQEPLMMEFGKDDHRISLGEGNHRLRAAELAGHTHVPVRMQRATTLDPKQSYNNHGDPMSRVKPGEYFFGEAAPSDVFDNFEKIGGISAKPKKSLAPNIETSKKAIMNIKTLISEARHRIAAGENIDDISSALLKLADEQGIGGATDLDGTPGDQEYDNMRETGEDLAGENDPNKGDQRRTGPRNDMVQEASSNKPCAECGMPTDQCICIDMKMPTKGKNPTKTTTKVDPRMKAPDVSKQAELNLKNAIKAHGKMTREASHMEEIEIPFSDLNLETGVNYHMSGFGAQQQVSMLVQRYLRAYVYPGKLRFTVARIEQNMNKVFVKVLVFDNQIEHEGSIASDEKMIKNSSDNSSKIIKTAWKKRLTEILGPNDKTGLVSCPVESNFLTRACGTCPLAANASTYIEDGYVECNFDNMSDYLNNGKQVHEHRPYQR
jgi:hypothetical protein